MTRNAGCDNETESRYRGEGTKGGPLGDQNKRGYGVGSYVTGVTSASVTDYMDVLTRVLEGRILRSNGNFNFGLENSTGDG